MAATLITQPSALSFTRNAVRVALQTDNITPDRAYVDLSLTGTVGPTATNTLTITMGVKIWTFVFADTPDSTGWQLPTPPPTGVTELWWKQLAEAFRRNSEVADTFFVLDVYPNIRLRHHEVTPLSITTTSNAVDITVTPHSVTSIVSVPNLSAHISVHDADTHESLLALNGSYNLSDRSCSFDIRAAFADTRPHLPTEYETAGVQIVGEQRAIHAYRRYYIRYSDRHGVPPKPEIMQRSDNFTVVHGGVSSGRVTDFFNRYLVPLHNYFTPSLDMPFVKSVTREQPDWLYVICPNNEFGLQIEYAVTYSSGEERLFQDNVFNAVAGEIRIIPTGWAQFQSRHIIRNRQDGEVYPVSYEFRIRQADGTLALKLVYELELFAAWNMYILLDNGIGGMESIRLKGKKTKNYVGESTIFEKNDGSQSTAFPQGFTSWEASTGWYEAYQCEHLAQLLLGQLWLIEVNNNPLNPTFTPVVADKQSFVYNTDDADEGLHALTFKFRTAHTETQSNRF